MNPSLVTFARRVLAQKDAPKNILVAVSGGPDSMALLHVLAYLAPKLGLALRAHGIDHQVRAAAARELDQAEGMAKKLGIPWDRTRVSVAAGGNVQENARKARWRALVRAARTDGNATIATAHHADDRAETVVMRLLRGAGARGLAVLPERSVAIESDVAVVRPFVRARRTDIALYVERHAIPFSTDPSNDDPRYLRTAVRTRVMPVLCELNPQIVRHLTNLADDLAAEPAGDASQTLPRATQEALQELVKSRSRSARVWLPGGLVAMLDPRLRRK